MISPIKPIFLFLLLLVAASSILEAEEITLDKILEWPEKTNQYGSPKEYIYLASPNKVQVFTEDGTNVLTRKLKRNQKMYSSDSGRYWGIASRSGKSRLAPMVTKFSVYSPSGNMIYEIKNPAALKFILCDRAPNIVGVVGTEGLPEASLRFFDEKGKFKNEYSISNYVGGQFCPDGFVFFAHSEDSGLYVFDHDGNLLYRTQIGRYYSTSNDGKLIITINNRKIDLYYKSSLTSSADMSISNPSGILLSDDDKYALVYSDTKAVCYNLPRLNVLWEYMLDDPGDQFSSCDFSSSAGRFIFGVAIDNGPDHSFSDRFTRGRVEVVNLHGQRDDWGYLTFKSWSKGYPRVEFSSSGDSFWVIGHRNIYKVPIN